MKDANHSSGSVALRELNSDELSMAGGGCNPFEGIGGITVSDEEYDRIVEELRKRNSTKSC